MSEHTPGPWHPGRSDMLSEVLDGYGFFKAVYPKDEHCTEDFLMVGRAYGRTEEEIFANARLIAAAPELLAACKLMLANSEGHYDAREWFDAKNMSRAAIRKAEGRSDD